MKETVFPGDFVQITGDTEHELHIPRGDQAIEYAVYSDTESWLYLHCESVVIPLAHGLSYSGRVLVRDAKWLLLRVAKKSAVVAARVASEERRLRDTNSGKPVATHVPAPPPLDVLAMARRLVGQKEDRGGEYLTPEDLEEMFPDDVDTEFGPGHVQLEEDEDIEDAIQARRARKAAQRASQNQPNQRAAGKEGDAGSERRSSDRGKPAERRPKEAAEDVD